MKITEGKLRDIIRQEISELTKATAQKSVSGKKINPKNIKDPAKPPKPKGKGKGGSGGGHSPDLNIRDCIQMYNNGHHGAAHDCVKCIQSGPCS